MKWALRICSVAGIGIFVHWTFLAFIAWILFSHLAEGQTAQAALEGVAFILAVFTCIVLHELGHALMARQFGIRTRDITLLPIGGVARLQRIPEKPLQEFLVAISGPAVNVAIAIVLAVVLSTSDVEINLADTRIGSGSFLIRLLLVNVGLVVFNLIPAFPMDGGRMLRALLSPMMGYLPATDTAATIGQIIAVLFGVLAFYGNGMLIFIALFIYMGAQQEAQMAHVRAILHGVPVRNAMMTTFRVISVHDILDTAIRQTLAGDQKDFPVLDGDHLAGMLRGKTLIEQTAAADLSTSVADVMQRDCKVVDENASLQDVFEQMQADDCSTVPVMKNGRLIGLVSLENIGAWLMIQAKRQGRGFANSV